MAEVRMQLEWASKEETFLRNEIESSLNQMHELKKEIPSTLANHLLQYLAWNCESAQPLFNTLLYYLERSDEIAQHIILCAIGEVVSKEANISQTQHFTNVVKNNINNISHGCGKKNSEVRACLHGWITHWIHHKIVPEEFLFNLKSEEQKWTFSRPPPRFYTPLEQSPSTFNLAMEGIIGRGCDPIYNNLVSICTQARTQEEFPSLCTQIVQNGIEDGIKDGWMYIDKDGHHKVRIE